MHVLVVGAAYAICSHIYGSRLLRIASLLDERQPPGWETKYRYIVHACTQ